MFFHFGIKPEPDGVQVGGGGQRVNMICGCQIQYVGGIPKWRLTLCWDHECELQFLQATLINRELPCCRN